MENKFLYIGLLFFLISFFTSGTINFIVLGIGIVLLSLYSSEITEELAKHYSPTIGGLINATLGNAGELIIGFFALREGLPSVVKASLSGSIIGNLTLLFGFSVLLGGFFYKKQKINKKVSETNSTLLMITIILIILPSLLPIFHEEKFTEQISLFIAFLMLIIYFASLFFSLVTHKKWFLEREKGKPKISKLKGWLLLGFSIFLMTIMSEGFASNIEHISRTFGFNDLFIGAIVVGLIGNIGEHIGSLKFAMKDKFDLVVGVSVGSALQIALFVLPVLVIIGHFMGNPLSLEFLPIESVSIFVSALLLNEIIKDSEVNWFEGLELLILYLVIAVLFFYV